jgi:hypothetical protein
MLLGLVRPGAGLIRVLTCRRKPRGLRRTGTMGETAFYPFLSGRDSLRAAARRCQVPDTRVEAGLEIGHRPCMKPSRPPATGRWLHRGAESGLRAAGSP